MNQSFAVDFRQFIPQPGPDDRVIRMLYDFMPYMSPGSGVIVESKKYHWYIEKRDKIWCVMDRYDGRYEMFVVSKHLDTVQISTPEQLMRVMTTMSGLTGVIAADKPKPGRAPYSMFV